MGNSTEYARVCEAYITMADQARYRPAAPNDGFGNTYLSEQQLADPGILEEESGQYALEFLAQENTARFLIGVSNYSTNRALVYVIEVARCLCSGQSKLREVVAPRLLALAMQELAGRSKGDG
jgi:hypothetical protein